ncbi:MAG TPA: agmatine deiminase family protein [Bacteroidales bacterium]|nr:agmatine deiminase family protein [Bacteroidales bacterium]
MNKRFTLQQLIFVLAILSVFPLRAQVGVVNPAEFEKNEGILLVWDYAPSRDSITANIARAAQQAGKVWIIYYPGQAPYDTSQIRSYLYSRGVLPLNLFFVPAWTETLWIRDFGPAVLYGDFGQGSERFIVDMGYSAYGRPKDDSIPTQLAHHWGWQHQTFPVQIEGGNLMFDGLKRGFASKRVLTQNPQYSPSLLRNMFIDRFQVDDFVFLDNLNNSGGGIWKHVDMWMKVLDYETILVSSYPEHLPDYNVIENNVLVLRSLTNAFGKPYTIIRIPAPPKDNGTWATTQNDEMRTYTNSLIINNTVIVPSYNLPEYDNLARQIYQQAMPGYKIIMVDSRNLTTLGGAIHCITREIPAPKFARIVHRKVTGAQTFSSDFYIYSNCSSNSPIQRMWLYYKKNNQTEYTRVPVYMACPENMGIIQGLNPGDTVSYYLEAITSHGNVTYPVAAPAANFTFWFDQAVGMPQMEHQQKMHIFPQPASEGFYIHLPVADDAAQVKIYDRTGRLVYVNDSYTAGSWLEPKLQAGVYVVVLRSGNQIFNSQLVISKR